MIFDPVCGWKSPPLVVLIMVSGFILEGKNDMISDGCVL